MSKSKNFHKRSRAVCPYYRGEFADYRWQNILCEGVHKGSPTSRQLFATREEKNNNAIKYCCGDYESCPIAKAIKDNKYRRTNNE